MYIDVNWRSVSRHRCDGQWHVYRTKAQSRLRMKNQWCLQGYDVLCFTIVSHMSIDNSTYFHIIWTMLVRCPITSVHFQEYTGMLRWAHLRTRWLFWRLLILTSLPVQACSNQVVWNCHHNKSLWGSSYTASQKWKHLSIVSLLREMQRPLVANTSFLCVAKCSQFHQCYTVYASLYKHPWTSNLSCWSQRLTLFDTQIQTWKFLVLDSRL